MKKDEYLRMDDLDRNDWIVLACIIAASVLCGIPIGGCLESTLRDAGQAPARTWACSCDCDHCGRQCVEIITAPENPETQP